MIGPQAGFPDAWTVASGSNTSVLNTRWAPGVASIHTPYLRKFSRRRHPIELKHGMQRPVWVVVSAFHVSHFTGCPSGVLSARHLSPFTGPHYAINFAAA
jgi:hypothetical protein